MWAMLSGTCHLKRPKLCGGVQELMQVCTPSSEWGICVLDLRRWCDCESHYDLRCVDCQGHFDVNCSKWRSHFDVACRVIVSLLHRHVQILQGVEEECNLASPPLSSIPFLSSPSPSCTYPLYRVKNSSSLPPSSYEFPNGYNQSFTVEKFKLCEGLFDSSTPNLKVQQTTCDWLHTYSRPGDLSHVSKHS